MSLYHLQLPPPAGLHAPDPSVVRPSLAGALAVSSLPGNSNGRGKRSLNARYDQLLSQVKAKGRSILFPKTKTRGAKPILKKLPSRSRGGLFSHSVSALPVSAPTKQSVSRSTIHQPAYHLGQRSTTSTAAWEREGPSFHADPYPYQTSPRRDGYLTDATPTDVDVYGDYSMDEDGGRYIASSIQNRSPSPLSQPNYTYHPAPPQLTPTPIHFHHPTPPQVNPQQNRQPMTLAQHRVRFRPAQENQLYSPSPATFLQWQMSTPKVADGSFASRDASMVSDLAGVGGWYGGYIREHERWEEPSSFNWAPAPMQMDVSDVATAPPLWQQPLSPRMEAGPPPQKETHDYQLSSSPLFKHNQHSQTQNLSSDAYVQHSPTPQRILQLPTNLGPTRRPTPTSPQPSLPLSESIPPQLMQAHQSLLPAHIKSSSAKAKKARQERSYKVKGRELVRLLEELAESESDGEENESTGAGLWTTSQRDSRPPLVLSAITYEPSPSRTLVNLPISQHSSSATKVPNSGIEGSSFDLSSDAARPSPTHIADPGPKAKPHLINDLLKRKEAPSPSSSPVAKAGKKMKEMSVREKIRGRAPTPGPTPLVVSQTEDDDLGLDLDYLDLDASECGSQLSSATNIKNVCADIPFSNPPIFALSQLPVLPLPRPLPDYTPARKSLQPRRKPTRKRVQRIESESVTSEEVESIRSSSEPPGGGKVMVDGSDDGRGIDRKGHQVTDSDGTAVESDVVATLQAGHGKDLTRQGSNAVGEMYGKGKGWVDEGFFDAKGGELGFRIWHD
ncbi:hypothetical protein L202_04693 [Cryptococcus amylolentus CBS 6039]|uniref:Uncharacterized protein n=1 Tax=Cryptococcus amylolentus CBS 6039 TaxID=1295533 RepID=A0A1E3HQ02_9TREE|nr:hypothetical protein L202_04693 [Cryptococcus amylolentus CBS 6039]ODN77521.1 hypothetical protein L202_04693 [Cryptococcus amylolentus CBS 6039]